MTYSKFGIPSHIQHFLTGVIATVVFPLLPLGAELKYSGTIAPSSIYIASIMYISAISLAYENVLIFVFGLIASIYLAIDYGSIFISRTEGAINSIVPIIMIVLFAVVQASKCYNLYISQKENFLYFPKVSS